MSDVLKSLITIAATRALSVDEARQAFGTFFDKSATSAQMAGLLMAMRVRGETVDEIAAAAGIMRRYCKAVKAPKGAIDIVGTGGDGKGTLNISTAAALVVAGAGCVVAKHGNRNLSSKSGAADVLSAIGVNIMVEPDIVERAINEIGIGFMMAPMHHPATAHVMPVRQELATRTIFNILGPLTNPAEVRFNLVGAFSQDLIEPMARVLGMLGSKRAWVVYGKDGTDELSICAPSDVAIWENGGLSRRKIHPEDGGLAVRMFDEILGGTPTENGRALSALLDGKISAYRDAVLLNAGAALVVCGCVNDLKDAVKLAAESIDSGKAKEKAQSLARLTNL